MQAIFSSFGAVWGNLLFNVGKSANRIKADMLFVACKIKMIFSHFVCRHIVANTFFHIRNHFKKDISDLIEPTLDLLIVAGYVCFHRIHSFGINMVAVPTGNAVIIRPIVASQLSYLPRSPSQTFTQVTEMAAIRTCPMTSFVSHAKALARLYP